MNAAPEHASRHASTQVPREAPELGNAARAGISLGIALVFFTVFHVLCGLLAAQLVAGEGDAWIGLAFVLALVLYGALAVLVLIPIAVFTVGLGIDVKTRHWPRLRAATVHGVAGLILGLSVAWVAASSGLGDWLTATVAFAVPPALAAFATHVVSPTAMRRRGIAWAAWAVASVAIVAALVFVVSVFVR